MCCSSSHTTTRMPSAGRPKSGASPPLETIRNNWPSPTTGAASICRRYITKSSAQVLPMYNRWRSSSENTRGSSRCPCFNGTNNDVPIISMVVTIVRHTSTSSHPGALTIHTPSISFSANWLHPGTFHQ
eukprot:TRINITY_DN2609_c2_g1_i1.p3 TRINITY_DN2609_c2_g1~~TRINITY_DN2609_c2_g1_i1.p3  ORF type:complete len:129 (-),score=10.58 TRINITY_DN2609_c2_g1_i1:251-637(-)